MITNVAAKAMIKAWQLNFLGAPFQRLGNWICSVCMYKPWHVNFSRFGILDQRTEDLPLVKRNLQYKIIKLKAIK